VECGRCQVLLNGEPLETIDWTRHDHVVLLRAKTGMNRIDVLVENCGRVNYANFDSDLLNNQHKGLSAVTQLAGGDSSCSSNSNNIIISG